MTTTEALNTGRSYVSKTSDAIIKIAAVIGAAIVVANAYAFYLNNIWKPDVEIIEVDFDKAIAKVKVGNREIYIYGDATFMINNFGDWGIRFGSSKSRNVYDRLELTKKNMVVEYLSK